MSAMVKFEDIVIKQNEPMSRHTSWRTGGMARRYVEAASLEALASFIATLPDDEELLWMGLGSNTLIRDAGFGGTVIATQGVMSQLAMLDESTVHAGAGVASAKLARFCDRNGLQGAEFFAGIPGLVGGALAMNAGAFGGETWPLVIEVETLNRKGEIRSRRASEYKYGYRHVDGPGDEWFVSATFGLKKKDEVQEPEAGSKTIDIRRLLAKRSASQPTGVASCGSVFRNPKGDHAARLIESCSLKGRRIGGAVVSEKHANFIINEDRASASDIESLIELVQQTVEDRHGIRLQPEVKIIGEKA
ncbi:MAG TPA: UDP-N-acetylmuramate dehydrogenase [Gammaproteobacteria bacterium]|nr:UDP-N-acetylmuramate dehydrogenase [Gammaproteobacteria bacterium]